MKFVELFFLIYAYATDARIHEARLAQKEIRHTNLRAEEVRR